MTIAAKVKGKGYNKVVRPVVMYVFAVTDSDRMETCISEGQTQVEGLAGKAEMDMFKSGYTGLRMLNDQATMEEEDHREDA